MASAILFVTRGGGLAGQQRRASAPNRSCRAQGCLGDSMPMLANTRAAFSSHDISSGLGSSGGSRPATAACFYGARALPCLDIAHLVDRLRI